MAVFIYSGCTHRNKKIVKDYCYNYKQIFPWTKVSLDKHSYSCNKILKKDKSRWSLEALKGKCLSLCLHMEQRKHSPEAFYKQ